MAYVNTYAGLKSFKNKLGYPHCDLDNWSVGSCLLMEIVATFFLVMMVYMTAVNSTKPKTEMYGLAIGGTLGIAVWTIGPMTGAGLNPWRVLGPAIITGELFTADYDYAWVYYLGNTLTGIGTGILWLLICMDKSDEATYTEDKRPLMDDE